MKPSRFDYLQQQAQQDNIFRLCVAAIILNKNKQVLLCQRSLYKKVAPGVWHMPGGGIDSEETIEEAMIRELQEELLLDVLAVGNFSGIVHDYIVEDKLHRTLFIPVQAQGKVELNKENNAYRFVSFKDLEKVLEVHVLNQNKMAVQYAVKNFLLSDVI